MKKQLLALGLVFVIGCAGVGVAVLLTNNSAYPASCKTVGTVHAVTIRNDKPSQAHITAHRCDRLKIINEDSKPREMAFGKHDDHIPYDGITERVLKQKESFSVILDKSGDYLVHDHFDDTVQITFTVRN